MTRTLQLHMLRGFCVGLYKLAHAFMLLSPPCLPGSCTCRNITHAPWCSPCYHRNHLPSNWQTYSGMQDQYKQDGVQRRPVKKIISHPDYNQMTFDYDIALLELTEPLEFTNTIQPICLPSSSHVFPAGMSCWVTGWGALREGGIMQELVILSRTVVMCFMFFSLTDYYIQFEYLYCYFSVVGDPLYNCVIPFLHIQLTSKLRHPTPPPSFSQLAIHLCPSSSFPACFLCLPFISFSFHPVFFFSFNVPPISLSLPSWHTSLPLNPPSLFSHLFLICSIPLSVLPYPYIKTDVGSPGKPLKPSLANTNPAH